MLSHTGIHAPALFVERQAASPSLRIDFPTATHRDAAPEWLAKLSGQQITYADALSYSMKQSRDCTDAMSFDHDFVVAGLSLWKGPVA